MYCFIVILSGCNYLHLRESLHVDPTSWKMYGGDIGRTNVARDILIPPLTMVWEYDASAGFGPYSVTVADQLLFIGNLQGEIHAVNVQTGNGIGVHDFGTAIVGAPVVDVNMLYVALAHDEESLVAYNMDRGAVEWSAKLGDIESSPLFMNDRLYVASLRGRVFCIDKNNGSICWTFTIPPSKQGVMIHSSPASDGNVIVVGCDNSHLYAIDAHNGSLKWSASTGKSILASPSVSDGKVFAGSLDNYMRAFDLETGREVWRTPLDAKIFSSQAVNERYVIVGTAGRTAYCLNKNTGDVVWKAGTNSVINAPPLVSGTVVYIGCIDKHLYAFDTETGKLLWQYKTEGRIKTMPVIWQNRLFLLSEDHTVLAFRSESSP